MILFNYNSYLPNEFPFPFCRYFLLSYGVNDRECLGTTQACLFKDGYDSLTSTGYSIYGLSTDSPRSNATFRTKQNLPYTLLCDPAAKLIAAIGMKKAPRGTIRGVFVISKQAKLELTFTGVRMFCLSQLFDRFIADLCSMLRALLLLWMKFVSS